MMRPTRSTTEQRSAGIICQDRAFQKESANEQEERANKTARMRALRRAKEASEREAAGGAGQESPAGQASADRGRRDHDDA